MIKNSLFLQLVFFCLSFNLIAQTPPHYIVGEKNFSNTDVYSLHFQESTNILFAATDKGVYSYSRNEFQFIKSSEKQFGSSFFSLVENNDGRLFCCNLSGQVFEVEGNNLHLFFETPKNENTKYCAIFLDKNDNLIIFTDSKIRKISSDGAVTLIDVNGKIIFNQLSQLPDGRIVYRLYNSTKVYVFDNNVSLLTNLKGNESNTMFFNLGGEIYMGSNQLKKVKDSTFSMNFSFLPKTLMYQKNEDEVFFASQEGVYSLNKDISNNNSIAKKELDFNEFFVSAIVENNSGTLFLGTFKDGVIVIPNRNVKKYNTDRHLAGIIANPTTNVIHLSDKKNNVYQYKDSFSYIGHYYNRSLDQLYFVNGHYELEQGNLNRFIHQTENKEFLFNTANNIKDLYEYKDEFFSIITPYNVFIIISDSFEIDNQNFAEFKKKNIYSFPLSSRGKSVCFSDFDSTLYYSTFKGIFGKKWNTSYHRSILFKKKSIIGNDLISYKDQLVIGTEFSGVLFHKNNKVQVQIDEKNGLRSNRVRKIEIKNDLLFILTSRGFQIFDLKSNQFIGLGDLEGVNSNFIYNFSLTHDQVWLLEKSGYSSVKIEDIQKNKEIKLPKLYLDSLLINSKSRSLDEHEFSFDENNVTFYFDYRSFETKRDAKYYYKLEGASNDWKTLNTNNSSIEFPSLSPGAYTFHIKVVYRGIETKTIKYKFTIQQPFWFQLWFIVLCFLGVVLMISSLFYFKIKRNKKDRKVELDKQKMQVDIFESKLKAIRSQMNPHFIFNSLNSIQSLVLKENKELSYDSIEQFSELVRKTLHFSEKNFVPIKEEMSFLQIYMELESLRMKDDFKFTLKNEFERNISIPSLLIQPFIENSIHHGLLHKEGEKHLEITFYKENNETYCSIIDNGIGREEARKISKRQNNMHQSFSLNAMKDRLKILSQQHRVEYNYKITDLYNDLNQPTGTKVVVHFPFQDEF